ncbi:hypothetical protein [Noviherbaspirillum album]|nr:hypothetical protein [Noviherbaspirillum sp. CPCC 100848]
MFMQPVPVCAIPHKRKEVGMLSCVRRIRSDYRHPGLVMEMCRSGTVAILQLDDGASIDGGQRREPIRSAMINSTHTSFPGSIKMGRKHGFRVFSLTTLSMNTTLICQIFIWFNYLCVTETPRP